MFTTGIDYIKQVKSVLQGQTVHIFSLLWILEFLQIQILIKDMKVEANLSGEQRGLRRVGNRDKERDMRRYVQSTLCMYPHHNGPYSTLPNQRKGAEGINRW